MIDFHCHLDLFANPQAAVSEVEAAGIYLLSVTTTPKAYAGTKALSASSKRIRTALGLHPQLVRDRHGEVDLFCELVGGTSYVGEVGLDGSSDHAGSLPLQREVLSRILRSCAASGGKIMSLHSRHASGELLELLQRHPGSGIPVFHWFSGPLGDLGRAVEMGAWFSVGLPMLQSERAGALIARIPRDRLLTETDAPFASTRDGLYPTSALRTTMAEIARHWKCDADEVRRGLLRNLTRLAEEKRKGAIIKRTIASRREATSLS
ncbi:TatD family hydrolase [Cereibacter sp. SYSU M97828]|nr:TatD family hydrolase [Cereibacter flavus]